MRLAATLAEPLAPRQMISSLTEEPEADITNLIDRLANRVGDKRLYRFAPVASDVPERSVVRVAPTAPATGAAWPDHWPRPSRLLPSPEPIETLALLPDQPPVTFTWRGIRRRVKRADGPERVFGEWWKRDAELIAVRDYFQVEDEAANVSGYTAPVMARIKTPARIAGFCTGSSHEWRALCRIAVHLAFLVPAGSQLKRRAVCSGCNAWH